MRKLHSVPDSTLSSVISSLNPDYIGPIICHYRFSFPVILNEDTFSSYKKNYLLNVGIVLTRAVLGFSRHPSHSVCEEFVAKKVELGPVFL
jgi:hypothetical protein